MSLPVSVQIITLNEEATLGECLDAIFVNDPQEVVVIDGGSTDTTVEIARSMGARVLTPGRLGRGASRTLGYNATKLPYVAMVDADDRISPDWLVRSLTELQFGNYAALQSSLRATGRGTFWERGWNEYFIESIRPTVDAHMVGHPAIFRTEALRGTREDIGHLNEDTQRSIDFEARRLRQGIGTAISYRVVPDNRRESVEKWQSYGQGYRDIVRTHPERRARILRHVLVTIPVVRGLRPVLRGQFESPVFNAWMAASILRGYFG